MSCPLTKTLRISFTPPSTPPDNGYRIKWRVVGDVSYTTAVGPFTSSPAELSNIPACSTIEGTVEAVCGATYSSVATFTVPAGYTSITCGSNLSGSQATTAFYIYPDKLIDLNNSGDSVSINWASSTIPNRFTIYNSNKEIIATTGWVGVQSGTGPWTGSSLNTATTGTLSFTKSTTSGDGRWYFLRVETVGHPTNTDTWTAAVACTLSNAPATWTITPSVNSVTEGSAITFNVTAPSGTSGTYYYRLAGLADADFSDNTPAGSFTVTNGAGSFSKTLVSDSVTEGAESFTATVRSTSVNGTVLATSTPVTVNDPSAGGGGGGTATYAATGSATSIDEGGTITINVTTTNVDNGTILYYSVENVAAADFADNTLTGSFVINNNAGSFSKTLANDQTTEGVESFNVRIRQNSTSGNIVASVFGIQVNDTSVTGSVATPTYTLSSLNANSDPISSINEGNNLTIKLTTTNVNNGTTIPYTVTGIAQGDLAGNSDALSGNFTINNNVATKNFYIDADSLTEGSETFTLSLTGLSKSISVGIVDTSLTPSWTGYTLNPVSSSDCVSTGDSITVYKLNSAGSIVTNDVLYTAQNTGSALATGYYSDGTYKYTVNTGTVSSKVECPPAPGAATYDLVTRVGGNIVASINEGQTVTFTLVTSNVVNGTSVSYTISGIDANDLASGSASLSGTFVVGSDTVKSFTLANDLSTEGTETMTMTLPNSNTVKSITIGDESITPALYYVLTACDQQVANAYTKITPTLGTGQRYVNPTGQVFYTYSGVSNTFSSLPSGYNGSIQATQFTGCPSI